MGDISGARRRAKSVSAPARAEGLAIQWSPIRWSSERQLAAAGLVLLVLTAIGLRLVPILVEPSLNWWDEVFQAIEPAHRLVYGYGLVPWEIQLGDRKSTRLNSSHQIISYAVFCLKKKNKSM